MGLPPDARARWFGNLATLVVERISDDVTVVRNTDTLGRFPGDQTAQASPRRQWTRRAPAGHHRPATGAYRSRRRGTFRALLETFVVTEVVKQLGWSTTAAHPFHYRTADGVEIDLVLEADDGRVTAIEIKAGSRLTTAATRGLVHLRDQLGGRFIAGLVLNTGNQAQRIGDRLSVAPVDQLWHVEQS